MGTAPLGRRGDGCGREGSAVGEAQYCVEGAILCHDLDESINGGLDSRWGWDIVVAEIRAGIG